MFLLPSAWAYETGLPVEAWISGFWTDAVPSHQWDRRGHSLFLHPPVWVRGTSISPRVLYEHLPPHRQAREGRGSDELGEAEVSLRDK